MNVLIIYDTIFGNTEQIARAIGTGIGSEAQVSIVRVSDVKPDQLKGMQLLIIGSPTRAFSPSPAMKEFLGSILANSLRGVRVAAFDTRIAAHGAGALIFNPLAAVFGYAAEPIANRLAKCGGQQVIPPEGFFVLDSEGPLKEGEIERAKEWGRKVVGA